MWSCMETSCCIRQQTSLKVVGIQFTNDLLEVYFYASWLWGRTQEDRLMVSIFFFSSFDFFFSSFDMGWPIF